MGKSLMRSARDLIRKSLSVNGSRLCTLSLSLPKVWDSLLHTVNTPNSKHTQFYINATQMWFRGEFIPQQWACETVWWYSHRVTINFIISMLWLYWALTVPVHWKPDRNQYLVLYSCIQCWCLQCRWIVEGMCPAADPSTGLERASCSQSPW